jgi:multidrug efflux pump subunit AcrA (membrane-fusion protein)
VLQSNDSPAAVAPPAPPRPEVSLPPLPGKQAVAPPPGVPERRQPPEPEAVIMSGFADGAAGARPGRRTGLIVLVWLIVLAGAAGAAYWVWSRQHAAAAPHALRVRVMSPAPSAVYRWFSGRGQVTDYQTKSLAFASAGRLAELLPAGTEVAAGDVVAKLAGASGLESLLAHDRSRVGFYKQLRDSMHAAGNRAEERQAEIHLGEKQKLVEMALAGLSKYTVVAPEPGEVIETLAKIGTLVSAGAPIARLKGRLLHGAFELDAEERATLAKMTFCRIEVVGLGPRAANDLPRGQAPATAADSSPADAQVGPRFFDCKVPGEVTAGGNKIEIPLPGDVGLVSGQPLRLARGRYDAVFPVPAGAVVADGERKAVWIAGRDGVAERRMVTVAENGDDALVTDGLRVGDQVIVDPPAGLQPGARVEAADSRP